MVIERAKADIEARNRGEVVEARVLDRNGREIVTEPPPVYTAT